MGGQCHPAYTCTVADEIHPIATSLALTGVFQELAGKKAQPFNTIRFVLYTFLYLTYTMLLASILHTIDFQYTSMTIKK